MPIVASSPSFDTLMPCTVNNVSFNRDASCFSVATSRGFRIYNCEPFQEIYMMSSDDEISVAGIINQTTTALVKVGSTDVLIWDNLLNRTVQQISLASEVLKCYKRGLHVFYKSPPDPPREVKAVKRVSDDLLLVVTEDETYELYYPNDIKIHHLFPTDPNPMGICCAVSSQTADDGSSVAVFPRGAYPCELRLSFVGLIWIIRYPHWRTKTIQAYFNSTITCLALSADGLFVAVHSRNSVRIFDTIHGYLFHEIQMIRKEDEAEQDEICSLAFSPDARWLAASSDKGVVYVFCSSGTSPRTSIGSLSRIFVSYIKEVLHMIPDSECLASYFHLSKGVRNIVAFGRQGNTLTIVGLDGSFYRCKFDLIKGGQMTVLEHHCFMKLKDG